MIDTAAVDAVDPDQIDLLDRDVFAQGVPHEWFAWLRRHALVFHHPEPDGPGFWVVTRYADLEAVTRDWQRNSNELGRGGVVGLEELPPVVQQKRTQASRSVRMIGTMDPPENTRYRKMVNRAFTPQRVGRLEASVRASSVELIEAAMANSACDFVVEVAAELPLLVICELVGVPLEDRHRVFEWSNQFLGSDDPEYQASASSARQARTAIYAYATDLAEQRRSEPRDDIASVLLEAEVDGERLSGHDFEHYLMALLVAGNETTRNAISNGLIAFLDHPDQYEVLRANPELIDSATEEILRWATPVMYFRRNVTDDYVLHGEKIRAGDKMSVWYISANRDEAVFAEPFRFDIRRDPNPHVAFGAGGPHFCLGAHLARLEIKVLFEELVRRVPVLEALGPPERLRSNWLNGIKHLPVRPRRADAPAARAASA